MTDYEALRLILAEVSAEDYRDCLKSADPQLLKDVAYPLERAFRIASEYTVELVALGLKELGLTPNKSRADLQIFADEGAISQRMSDQLAKIHRARNEAIHEYPDVPRRPSTRRVKSK